MEPIETKEQFDLLRVAAEQLLSIAFGSQIHINKIDRMTKKGRRNLLLRCHTDPVSDRPSSFILKKVEAKVYNPDDKDSWNTVRFFRDWVGSQFLNEIPRQVDHSPICYGGDRPLGFFMLEDVAHQSSTMRLKFGHPF